MNDIEKRFVDLEMRFMSLERFIHELSDVVAAQQRAMTALEVLAERLRARIVDTGESLPSEEPPHY